MANDTGPSVFRRDGDYFVATDLARGPWDAQALHGGAPAALLAHVAGEMFRNVLVARACHTSNQVVVLPSKTPSTARQSAAATIPLLHLPTSITDVGTDQPSFQKK